MILLPHAVDSSWPLNVWTKSQMTESTISMALALCYWWLSHILRMGKDEPADIYALYGVVWAFSWEKTPFPSPARDQCFTRLAKMRWNTVTYWTTADFANRETCSFIRLNDSFRRTLPQVAKRKSRKLTDHGKQLLPRMLISNVFVLYDKERIVGNDRYGRGVRRLGKM